jgi:hypothetical protein
MAAVIANGFFAALGPSIKTERRHSIPETSVLISFEAVAVETAAVADTLVRSVLAATGTDVASF